MTIEFKSKYSGYDIEVPKSRNPLLIKTKVTNFKYLGSINLLFIIFQGVFFNLDEFKDIKLELGLYQGISISFLLISYYAALLFIHIINGITNLFGISITDKEFLDYTLREGRSYDLIPQLEI